MILVRVCSNLAAQPGKVENLRVELVDKQTILLLWHDRKDSDAERCIRSYEVFYATTNDSDDQTVGDVEWTLLTRNKHLPFLSYCHANDGSQNSTLAGMLNKSIKFVKGLHVDCSRFGSCHSQRVWCQNYNR